jgi:hypothetical protein
VGEDLNAVPRWLGPVPSSGDKWELDGGNRSVPQTVGRLDELAMVGLFDGHGANGRLAAQFIRRALPQHLVRRSELLSHAAILALGGADGLRR